METSYKSRFILDDINIQQIKELSAKLEESKANHDLVNQKSYTERIISKVGQLSPEVKDKFNILVYVLHSELSTSLINEREYQEAINHLELAKSMPEYENNKNLNKCILLRLLSFSKLFLGLNTDSESLILEAKKINQKLINNAGKITSGELKKHVLDDKNIIEAWEADNLKTIIEFEIPFPLMITDQPIEFEYNNIKHIIKIELIPSPINPMSTSGGAFAEIVEDKYGLAHWSKIKLIFLQIY